MQKYNDYNTQNYRRLSCDPTKTNHDTANNVLKTFHKERFNNKNITEGLKVESPKSTHFHLKLKLQIEGILGRPIISSVNLHTSKIS